VAAVTDKLDAAATVLEDEELDDDDRLAALVSVKQWHIVLQPDASLHTVSAIDNALEVPTGCAGDVIKVSP